MFYYVADANEYLIKTGLMIDGIVIERKTVLWPGQVLGRISMTPNNYTLSLHAMTVEKLEFLLPAVFTIGPEDKPESLQKYARLLANATNDNNPRNNVEELVRGIVEGETRVIAAALTIEEIFKERKLFKEHVMKSVQSELSQFGMVIYNANVKELQDAPGSEYFKYLRLKSHEGAINQAKVDVAQAKFKGAVGEKEREGEQRKATSKIESDAVVFEQGREIEMSEARSKLQVEKTGYDNLVEIARIEAQKKAEMKDAELQKDVEVRRAMVQQEKQRAEKLSVAIVESEIIKTLADAQLYKARVEADAKLYTQQKDAEAILLMYDAQAGGIQKVHAAFKGDSSALLQYLMLEKGLYQELAKANADAIRGLEPKITVWNTGPSEGSDSGKAIRDIFQSLPPLLSTINQQTGIEPPKWLAKLPGIQQ